MERIPGRAAVGGRFTPGARRVCARTPAESRTRIRRPGLHSVRAIGFPSALARRATRSPAGSPPGRSRHDSNARAGEEALHASGRPGPPGHQARGHHHGGPRQRRAAHGARLMGARPGGASCRRAARRENGVRPRGRSRRSRSGATAGGGTRRSGSPRRARTAPAAAPANRPCRLWLCRLISPVDPPALKGDSEPAAAAKIADTTSNGQWDMGPTTEARATAHPGSRASTPHPRFCSPRRCPRPAGGPPRARVRQKVALTP